MNISTTRSLRWLLLIVFLQFPSLVLGLSLQIEVHFPTSRVRELPDNSIFALLLCYSSDCPDATMWNQTIPGFPYNPDLTIYGTDMVSENLYIKTFELPNATEEVYVVITATSYQPGNPFGNFSILDGCTATPLDPISDSCAHVGMPYQSVLVSPGHAVVTAYPYFSMGQGAVYTMFEDMYSPQFHNYRDISVYVPASLLQNNLNRSVNVLVVNDGNLFWTQQLAFIGGFDSAVLKGAIPETIMVSLPQNGTGCERQYELTFSQTTNPVLNCRESGANLEYFEFIMDNVIPAVIANLSVTLGEVGMTGVSYGGLTACYAASALPKYFRRVFCQSPSTWWNYGQLPSVILANAPVNGIPLSVVIYIGTIEMESPNCVNNISCTNTTTWFASVNDTANAFLDVGVPADRLLLYTVDGAGHDKTAWASSFYTGITQMYSPNFTTVGHQMQYAPGAGVNLIDAGVSVSPEPSSPSCSDDDDKDSTDLIVVITVLIIVVIVQGAFLGLGCAYQWSHRKRHPDVGGGASKGDFSENPMTNDGNLNPDDNL